VGWISASVLTGTFFGGIGLGYRRLLPVTGQSPPYSGPALGPSRS